MVATVPHVVGATGVGGIQAFSVAKPVSQDRAVSRPAAAGLALLGVGIFAAQVATPLVGAAGCEAKVLRRAPSLGPVYVVAPWAAFALLYVLVRSRHRGQAVGATVWLCAVACLVTGLLCPISDVIRFCDHHLAIKGDVIWLSAYSFSELMLLVHVIRRVEQLAQHCSARWLTRLFVVQVIVALLTFVPCIVYEPYVRSRLRLAVALVFIMLFMAITSLSTRAILAAADAAEVVVAARLAKGSKMLPGFYEAVHWTRLSARITLCTLVSSIALQVSLYAWSHANYSQQHWTRAAADYAECLDFVLNALAAAFLAGAVGPQDSSRDAMEQVGAALLTESEPSGAGVL